MSKQGGIGCKHCDGTGWLDAGSGRAYIAGGNVYEDELLFACPHCTPPDLPDDEPANGDFEMEAVW